MKVILLEDVKSLGKKGEIVNVNDGYARNYVLPKKLGVEANNKNMNDLKLQKANDEKVAKELLDKAKSFAQEMEKDEVVVFMALCLQRKLHRPIRSNAARKLIRKRLSFLKRSRALGYLKWVLSFIPA